ncbi:hypothetical protein MAR_023325 [Mya arenaria]|uniref:Uncharacterized protein n=1 Tax=Mya arenaria TaxID=6604 RepID=A0ABY7DMN4_MYAAR|nr:hypothetical protein MAR_023325 [Mya arenaria]
MTTKKPRRKNKSHQYLWRSPYPQQLRTFPSLERAPQPHPLRRRRRVRKRRKPIRTEDHGASMASGLVYKRSKINLK